MSPGPCLNSLHPSAHRPSRAHGHPHSRVLVITSRPGALWRQALPRRSRNTTAAVRRKCAKPVSQPPFLRSTGGRKRPGGPPKRKHPRVLAPRWVYPLPPGPAASPLLQGSTNDDQANCWGFCASPRADCAGPSLHLSFLLAVQSSAGLTGVPPGIPLFGTFRKRQSRVSLEDRAQGFSWDKLKVSTHELWDLRKTTLITKPAVT